MTQLVRLGAGGKHEDPESAAISLTRKGYLRIVMQVIIYGGRLNEEERKKLLSTELLYGMAGPGVYGTCLYERWFRDGVQDVIQVSAFVGETLLEKWITIAHELGHVLAGQGKGHGPEWKTAARRLGLLNPKATDVGCIDDLDADLVKVLQAIPLPTDGQPICDAPGGSRTTTVGGCKAGIGTRDGKTHGPGTGRLRLWLCQCPRPYRVRVASDDFRARCLNCGALFKREGVAQQTTKALVQIG